MKLTEQEQKVYDYIRTHPGCTTHDISHNTNIQKPCARIRYIEKKGVVVERRGEVKYPGTRAFKKLYIDAPLTTRKSQVYIIDDPITGRPKAVEIFKEVPIV